MDPGRIESLIGPDTKAILAVHVFGVPCDVDAIQEIADNHGLRVIYDAAHAFGVKYHGRHLAEYGDMAMLSFHATKAFTTLEGGALVLGSPEQRERVDLLGNFGIVDAENISAPGINAKMNELEAAFGLAQLDSVEEEITKRGAVYRTYREMLADMPGLRLRTDTPNVQHNYCSCPMLVKAAVFGMTRDEVCRKLEEFNVIARKYYYPLCSDYPHYAHLPSSDPHRLPCAHDVAREILCLPCYGELDLAIVERICSILRELYQLAARK
jgi:dTDP-4-amino-4,6-dideoxygalactose transaminase